MSLALPDFADIVFDQVLIRQLDQSKQDYPTLKQAICTPEIARQVVYCMAALVEDEPSRCHIPGFAVDMMNDGECVFSANICWACNNMRLSGPMAKVGWATFAAESAPAKTLLFLCKGAVVDV